MIMSMPTTARRQRRDDHRLRNPVQRTGDVTVPTDLRVPRSTARGGLRAAPTVVVCLSGCSGPRGAGASDREPDLAFRTVVSLSLNRNLHHRRNGV
jgi:hypothetical protein